MDERFQSVIYNVGIQDCLAHFLWSTVERKWQLSLCYWISLWMIWGTQKFENEKNIQKNSSLGLKCSAIYCKRIKRNKRLKVKETNPSWNKDILDCEDSRTKNIVKPKIEIFLKFQAVAMLLNLKQNQSKVDWRAMLSHR